MITTSTTGTTTTFVPTENLYDPTNKFRTSTPQALIDTDFEYGTQVSKWENLALVDNKPFCYPSAQAIPQIVSMQYVSASRMVIVTLGGGVAPANGTPIFVQDALLNPANGNFIIETGGGTTVFTYSARSTNNSTFSAVFDSNKTSIFTGSFYSNSKINPTGNYIVSTSGKLVTVQCLNPHGLSLGNNIDVVGITGTNPPNGSVQVTSIVNQNIFTYVTLGSVPSALTVSSMDVYVRPSGQFLHRPFDGGVIFSANAGSNYEKAIRQTRRYFRYQSGKGIQMSSGTILKPNLQVDSITASGLTIGSTITVQTKERHNLQPGSQISIVGVTNDTGYNAFYGVVTVTGYNTFTVAAQNVLTSLTAAGVYYVSISNWYGAYTRLGMFDDQNGLFFEFDGTTLYAVRRNSTFQLPGRYSVTNGSSTVSQTTVSFPTLNIQELSPGDYVVIRGQSYRITDITDNTAFSISPAYRGSSATMVQISKTIDTKIPQSQWNLDKFDGTGTSGFNLDLSKMQMFYIDFSWYGAGFVRWGMRANNGTVTYCHKLPNNNVNTEAYMRSGNLPARYENGTQPFVTKLSGTLSNTSNTVPVVSTTGFPSTGTLMIRDNSKCEFVNYTGLTSTTFTGVTREQTGNVTGITLTIASGSNVGTVSSATGIQVGQRVVDTTNGYIPEGTFVSKITGTTITLSQASTGLNPSVIFIPLSIGSAQTFTVTNINTSVPVSVELAYPSFSPTISHWGTSVIMDGRFDDDKSLLFTYGQTAFTTLAPNGGTTSSVTTANTSTAATLSTANPLIIPGMSVSGTNITGGTVVQAISGTSLTLSLPATGSATSTLTFSGLTTKALMSIRIAPSVDNGQTGIFGARELINRMQLVLRTLDVTTRTINSNLLVTAILNGIPSSATSWQNIVLGNPTVANSSLAQIADYSGGITTVSGGEVTGGFFLNTTTSIDLSLVRDLGNAIMGGGGLLANNAPYPDGPDVLTILVTNLASGQTADVTGRLGWTEAQA
jgi:hypothetical protein